MGLTRGDPVIAVRDLCLNAGDFSLRHINLDIPEGAYGVLMGSTGCGKTTLIECIAGLSMPSSGHILLGGREVTTISPSHRGIGYVPQDGALFPSLTVSQQLGFALEIRRTPRARITEKVEALADTLRLSHLLHRLPDKLSGGEKQRVALGRALAFDPQYLLLDEPLAALDEQTREEMILLLKKVQRSTGVTALHVTHHPLEAARLGDILYRWSHGSVELTTEKGLS